MNRIIFILTVFCILMAQDEDPSAVDTSTPPDVAVDTTSNDSLAWAGDSLGAAVDTIGPPMDLDYGYKGKSGAEKPLFQKTLITNKPA